MGNSEFCLSPLGQYEGDSDRYLPALLYGCVRIRLDYALLYCMLYYNYLPDT